VEPQSLQNNNWNANIIEAEQQTSAQHEYVVCIKWGKESVTMQLHEVTFNPWKHTTYLAATGHELYHCRMRIYVLWGQCFRWEWLINEAIS